MILKLIGANPGSNKSVTLTFDSIDAKGKTMPEPGIRLFRNRNGGSEVKSGIPISIQAMEILYIEGRAAGSRTTITATHNGDSDTVVVTCDAITYNTGPGQRIELPNGSFIPATDGVSAMTGVSVLSPSSYKEPPLDPDARLILYVNDDNDDGDYGDDTVDTQDYDNSQENDFTYFTMDLSSLGLTEGARIRFIYDDNAVKIWTKSGSATRNPASILSVKPPVNHPDIFDTVYNGMPDDADVVSRYHSFTSGESSFEYYANWLGIGPSQGRRTLYVEGLKEGKTMIYIWVNLDSKHPDPPPGESDLDGDNTMDFEFAIPVIIIPQESTQTLDDTGWTEAQSISLAAVADRTDGFVALELTGQYNSDEVRLFTVDALGGRVLLDPLWDPNINAYVWDLAEKDVPDEVFVQFREDITNYPGFTLKAGSEIGNWDVEYTLSYAVVDLVPSVGTANQGLILGRNEPINVQVMIQDFAANPGTAELVLNQAAYDKVELSDSTGSLKDEFALNENLWIMNPFTESSFQLKATDLSSDLADVRIWLKYTPQGGSTVLDELKVTILEYVPIYPEDPFGEATSTYGMIQPEDSPIINVIPFVVLIVPASTVTGQSVIELITDNPDNTAMVEWHWSPRPGDWVNTGSLFGIQDLAWLQPLSQLGFASMVPNTAIARVSLYTNTGQLAGSRSIRLGLMDLKVDLPPIVGDLTETLAATLTLLPSGTGFMSEDTTVSFTGRVLCDGINYTSNLKINNCEFIYDDDKPDEIQVLIEPPVASWSWSDWQWNHWDWLLENRLILEPASSYSVEATFSVGMDTQGTVTDMIFERSLKYQSLKKYQWGILFGDKFTPVQLIHTDHEYVVQIYIKDVNPNDTTDDPPDGHQLNYTLKSYKAEPDSSSLVNPPAGIDNTIDNVIFTKLATSDASGYHTYRSDPNKPIIPTYYEKPSYAEDTDLYIYIEGGGKVKFHQ